MMTGRQDIIGDLARLRHRFLSSAEDGDGLLDELELSAAVAIQLGMSYWRAHRPVLPGTGASLWRRCQLHTR